MPDWLNGAKWQLVGEFTEKESGKLQDRPQLKEALRLCRLRKATLVIAKLERLARDVAFLSSLRDSPEVEFVAVDFLHANRLTIHILAAVAEHEAHMISERTRAAPAVKKGQLAKEGKRLGTPKPHLIAKYAKEGSAAGLKVRQERQGRGRQT